ncbi:hypothetical protein P7I26_16320 [Enterococcus casseliflavus]|uniref:hypothetical protein n=1 Tax=Enterococcus casseliflavus TaxID=37734 RepID=UPI0028927C8C|nr:hypothetical protein [Enterococcus casseliflavus]MDT2987788.1 hypothetical protein [Enterococcus casseliflavus]
MATVSRGEITITNVDDGKPSYTHWAYAWSADGTDRFTTSYPNENLLRNSESPNAIAYYGATLTKTADVSVPEWNAATAVEYAIIGGASTIACTIQTRSTTPAGVKENYDISIYVKNTGSNAFFLNGNVTGSVRIEPGEAKRVTWLVKDYSHPTGANRQFVINRLVAGEEIEFVIWKAKFAYGTYNSIWTPSPYDDFANAYPTFAGSYVDDQPMDSEDPAAYTWQRILGQGGEDGKDGESAPLISLSGATQAITVDKDGKITPASSFAVTGTAVNTAISNWTYSLNGGNFGSAVPTGVTRSGNTVTIDPTKAVFDTFTIKAADATVSDVFTISRIKDGGEGPPGSDAYTVFLTNESYTFAGSTTAALAGSTTTEVIVYKGINKITPTSITVGTKPTGLSSSVSGSVITLTATTALVSKSGTVPITIIADGKTFTKQFAYALSLQGGKGDPGDPGKGVSAEEISYAISQDGVNPPTSGWSGTRPTPKAGWYMWTRTRFKYTDNTYSAYFYLVAQQGNDAIVISDTAPANPTKGTLWQDSSVVPQIIKVFDGTAWSMWGMPIDNLLATNILSENGVFKRLEGAEIVNTFSYTDSGVTYTGTTTIKDGNVTIARTGSDGSTWTTTMDRVQGFVDTYKASSSSPARIAQLGQGKLYLAESGVGGYLPAAAVNPASWTNLPYASGFTTAENNPCQYRKVQIVDGSWELQLRGQIKPTSGDFSTTASPTGGILPAGFRPIRNELVTAADSTKKGARVVVLATGEIQINTPNGGNYVSFGGIRIAL